MLRSAIVVRAALSTLLVVVTGQSVLGGESTEPVSRTPPAFDPAQAVVFTADRATELLAQCSRPTLQSEGTWTPKEQHIRELERRLAFELAKALQAWPAGFQAPDYYRQYVGVVVSGRRVIYVNGFHRATVENDRFDWKAKPVIVCDGGHAFWHAAYDPERRTFVSFRVGDGPARTVVFNGVA